ncbi:MAG: hypothetical protein AABZ64_04325 [Nitrospinota bacterium]
MKPEFLKTSHGQLGCGGCHGGDPAAAEKEKAHAKRAARPSEAMAKQCGGCHGEVVKRYQTSLHFTTRGYDTVMRAKSGAKWPEVHPLVQENCHSCHASCGDCHVRWPAPAGGGLLRGHMFVRKPPAESTCNGCHSGRVSAEYFGGHSGVPADVHWGKAKMDCMACHQVADLHGDGTAYAHRSERASQPDCLKCHPQAAPGKSSLAMHNVHGGKLECHVCHSVKYTNCFGCHLGKGAQPELGFRIGLNLRPDRPYAYNLVRHAPTTREMLASKVADALPHYDDFPTWLPTFPHNIQRVTPQNRSCDDCHGNAELFLRKERLDPRYPKANARVAVPRVPPKLGAPPEGKEEKR